MKTILLLAIVVTAILIAGCTTATPSNPAPVTPTAEPTLSIPAGALPMDGSVKLGNDTHSITVFICNESVCAGDPGFQLDNQTTPGKHTISIHIDAKNTGTDLIRYTWFSKLTDIYGNSYGGILLSHGGYGAITGWRAPGQAEDARDYVEVDSDQGLADLSKGAILDVYFMENKPNQTISYIPDYHVTWVIDPGVIV